MTRLTAQLTVRTLVETAKEKCQSSGFSTAMVQMGRTEIAALTKLLEDARLTGSVARQAQRLVAAKEDTWLLRQALKDWKEGEKA